MPSSTISNEGQITLPLEVRQRLGVKEGDRIEFVFEEDRTILRPARAHGNPFEEYLGVLPAFGSRAEINAWIRELRDEDPGEDSR